MPSVLVLLLLLLVSVSVSPSSAAPAATTLSVELFNDSACSLPLSIVNISQPIPVNSLYDYGSTCWPAPASLSQLGYTSYYGACGLAQGPTQQLPVLLRLWSQSANSGGGISCPNVVNSTTAISLFDNSTTHTSASCVGPISVSQYDSQANLIRLLAYVQFDCRTSSGSLIRAQYTMSAVILLLLLLLLFDALG